MAATFPCPYCGASYPVKPVLVGRPVRCTTCRNVFQLREDGVADRVDPPEAPAAPEPSPWAPPAAPQPPAAPPSAAAVAAPPAQPVTDSITASPATPAEEREDSRSRPGSGRKHSSRLTVKQEEMRRSMAASLKDAAERALASEQVRREQEQAVREQKKAALKEGGVGQIKPAVLTGEGEREAGTSRAWAIGCGAVLALALALWLGLRGTSAERQALRDFVEPAPESDEWARGREEVIRRRAWLYTPALPYLINLDDAELEPLRVIDLSRRADAIAALLGGQVLLPGRVRIWVAAAQQEAAQQALAKASSALDAGAQGKVLDKAGIAYREHEALMQELAEAVADPAAAGLLRLLLEGRTDADGGNWIRQRLCLGDPQKGGEPRALVPGRIELIHFQGSDGKRVQRPPEANSRQYVVHERQRYRGRLLRFADPGWASAADGKPMARWRVLDVQVANREGRFPPTWGYPDAAPEAEDPGKVEAETAAAP